jgi:hypothetical protein
MHLYNNGTDVVNAFDNLAAGTTIGGSPIGTGSGSVTSVSGTGTVQGLTLSGTVTSSGNLTLGGSLSAVNLASQVTGTLPAANGGTAQSTYTTGDLIYASGTNTLSKRSIGSTGQVLTVSAGVPTWATPTAGGVTSVTASSPLASSGGSTPNISFTGTLGVANGGTGQNTYIIGDLLYASGVSTLTKRAIGTNGQVLTVSAGVPTWATPTGNTAGAESSVDNGVVLFSGTLGKTLKSSAAQDGFVYGIRVGRGAGGVSSNTVLGGGALNSNTTGTSNTGVGSSAVRWSTTTSHNTGIGANSLSGTSLTGGNNTAVGSLTLTYNTSGNSNVAVGYNALLDNTTGSENTAVGRSALDANTTGSENVAIGYGALTTSTTTSDSTAVGHIALANSTGQQNTALGSVALNGVTTETNCTGLGYQAAVTGSNQVQLGNASTGTYAYGAVQNRSDARDKADIRDTQLGLSFITALRPVDFKWDYREDYRPPILNREDFESDEAFKQAMQQWVEAADLSNLTHDGTHKRSRYHHGLIAQEVKAVLDTQGIDFGGYQDHSVKGGKDVMSIGYTELIAPMVKAIQELKAELDFVKAELAALKG